MDRQGPCSRFLRQRRLERATQISAFAPNSPFRRGQGGLDLRAGEEAWGLGVKGTGPSFDQSYLAEQHWNWVRGT